MADIFLSYASEDRERVRPLVERLEEHGWDVWWDREIPPGMTWPQVIEQALAETMAMVVVWTEASVASKWVLIETSEGEQRGGLIPVALNRVKPPLQFRLIQAADLVEWDGSPTHPQFRAVVAQLERTLGVPPRVVQERERQAEAAAEAQRKADQEAEAKRKADEAAEAQRKADQEATETQEADEEAAARQKRETEAAAALLASRRDESRTPPSKSSQQPPETPQSRRQASGTPQRASAPASAGPKPPMPDWLKPASIAGASVVAVVIGFQFLPSDRASATPDPTDTLSAQPGTTEPAPPTLTPPAGATDPLNRPIWIEGGTFQMGSTGGRDNEEPVHQVTVSGFWIQEHEVTNEEYQRFDVKHSFPSGQERHPVVNVKWQEAMDYAGSRGGSLPTEAQWEFAARGTAGRTYPWGEAGPTCQLAHYSGCDPSLSIPVMSRPGGATPEGVYDLGGNVWEWTADWYGLYGASAATDPAGPSSGTPRVLRGGSFSNVDENLRGASRSNFDPDYDLDLSGFRVVWSSAGGQD